MILFKVSVRENMGHAYSLPHNVPLGVLGQIYFYFSKTVVTPMKELQPLS